MRILLRMLLRNLSVKPFRTAVIVLCMAAVTLTFSLCLTVSIAARTAVETQLRSTLGRTDLIAAEPKNGFADLPELSDGAEVLPVVSTGYYAQIHSISNYKYVQHKKITVLGTDAAQAYAFGLLPQMPQLAAEEAVISYGLAQRFGYKVGDTLTVPCADGAELTLTVREIALPERQFAVLPSSMVVAPETARQIAAMPDALANVLYVDAPDGRITETAELLAERSPGCSIQQITGTAELEEMTRSMTRTFFLLFAVTLLMIVFIITSLSQEIASERLVSIGTLRSIGAEKRTASMLLLAECTLYGLLGGVLGAVLFYVLKDLLLGGMMPIVGGMSSRAAAPFWIPLTGVVLAAAVSCVVSMVSIIPTERIPIRDILFGGKDTVYHPSAVGAVIGGALLCGAVVLYFLPSGFWGGILSLTAFVTGLCLILPGMLSGIATLTAEHTSGGRCPVLRLAVIQSGTKKTAVTGTVICTAAMMLAASLYVLAGSAGRLYTEPIYRSDVIVTGLSERAERYDVIRADQKELLYYTSEQAEINGRSVDLTLFGYDGFTMFTGLRELPETLGEDEIAFDKRMMRRLGIAVGDTVTLTLKQSSVRPVTLTLRAVQGIDSIYFDTTCHAAAVALDVYRHVYHDYPAVLLANGDPEQIARQLIDKEAESETTAEYERRVAEASDGITDLLYALAAAGILLAVVAVSGNQVVGFTQRRHELAVLRSQGMGIAQLSRMLLLETAVTALLPAVLCMSFGWFAVMLITKTLAALEMYVPIAYRGRDLAVLLAAAAVAVMLTSLLPIISLRRMNTAAELKQE